jgi:Contractile injection system tube protein
MTQAMATFREEGKVGEKITVHFNPSSLKLAVTNTIPDEGGGANQTKAKSASKLDLELIFDSTDDGTDVRNASDGLKKLGFLTDSNKPLPKVVFEWGTFSFTGVIESLNENFDFFSDEGVPLRETMAVSLKGLKLDEKRAQEPATGAGAGSLVPPGNGARGTTGLAQGLGNPAAGRSIAAQNGVESMRFPGAAPLAVGGDVALKGPAGLSLPQGGAALSFGGVVGGLASAGVTASGGAFSGLGNTLQTGRQLKLEFDPAQTLPAGAAFDLTGRVKATASALFNLR